VGHHQVVQYSISYLHSPPPLQSSVSMAELLMLNSWYFGLCPGLGVSSSLSSTLFYFLPLPFFVMVFCLCLPICVSPTVSSTQSTRDDLLVILCKVLESSPSVTILLGMGVSLWVSSSSVMDLHWTGHAPSSLELDFMHRKETTLLACQTDLLSGINRLVASGRGGCS
jgi:hypothetical protein